MMLTTFARTIIPAVLLLWLSACASPPQVESNGEFFNNSMITAKIKSKLVDDPKTGLFQIRVDSFKGIVQLKGVVNTQDEKHRAEVIAYSVAGVKKVDNSLRVASTQ
ncbi:MAG: BON domain-containing protein [Gammaproteobacteria bacterium]|jgi:osmotically-inducible protein OsmY